MTGRNRMPEISADTVRQMDEANRRDIGELKQGQEKINDTLLTLHGTLARIDERLKDQKDIEERVDEHERDLNQAKGVGKVAMWALGLSDVGHWLFSLIHNK